jgi:hypothetical protein
MAESPSEEDIERVANKYVDPGSAEASEQEDDLADAGLTQSAIEAFSGEVATADDVAEEATSSRKSEQQILTRDDVKSAAEGVEQPAPGGSTDGLVESAAEELAAPSEGSLQRARAQAAQQVDDEGVLRSDPDLDPLADGDQGREITDVSGGVGSGRGDLGDPSNLQQSVQRTGSGTGQLVYENASGDKFPVAEVDL